MVQANREILLHTKLTQVIDRKDFEGRDILIVDDLIVGGGTFIGLYELLKTRNVGKLYLAVSHVTIKNPNPKLSECFEKIYCTDSKYDTYDLSNLKIFKWDE